MDDPSRPGIRGVQTWARAAAVAELRPALDVPDEVMEAYVDAAALLVECEHRQVGVCPAAEHQLASGPHGAGGIGFGGVAGADRRSACAPACADYSDTPTELGFVRDRAERRRAGVLPPGAVRLERLARAGSPARIGRRRSVRPVAGGGPGQTSAYSVPVQLEPDEARLFAAALDEGARLVDRARAVTR